MVRKFLKEENGAELYFYPGTEDKVHIEWSRGHNPDFVVVSGGKSRTIDLSPYKDDYDGMHALFKEHFNYKPKKEGGAAQAKAAVKQKNKSEPVSVKNKEVIRKTKKKEIVIDIRDQKPIEGDKKQIIRGQKPIKPLSKKDREYLLNKKDKPDYSLQNWLIWTCSFIVLCYLYSNRKSFSQKCLPANRKVWYHLIDGHQNVL